MYLFYVYPNSRVMTQMYIVFVLQVTISRMSVSLTNLYLAF